MCLFRNPNSRFWRRAAPAVLAAWLSVIVASPASEDETLERFLDRLGLVDLHILHLEQAVERAAGGQRLQAAQRLADLYAERLMRLAEEPDRYEELASRIDALIREIPEANTPSLQVTLLQADFNRAETQIVKWMSNPSARAAPARARQVLKEIAPQLDRHQRELNVACAKLAEQLDAIEDEDLRTAREQELRRRQTVAGRAAYFAGWANYYLGLTEPDAKAAQNDFLIARGAFRRLLDIEPGGRYQDVNAEWLGLESVWRSRAVVGLGLVEAARGDLPGSAACLDLLDSASTPPLIRDQVPYWRLQGLLTTGRLAEAVQLAQEQLAARSTAPTPGRVSFCAALLRAGLAGGEAQRSPVRRQLAEWGARGLARLGQFRALDNIVAELDPTPATGGGFYLTWLQGQRLLARAESSQQASDYEEAARVLAAALEMDQAAPDVPSAARCRDRLAVCLYHLGRYENAARQFRQSADALKDSDSTTAAKAAWNAFVSYQRLLDERPRYAASALDALQWIQEQFPDAPEAKNADLQIARLRRSIGSLDQSIAALAAIEPGGPNYARSRYELAAVHRERWLKAPAGRERSAAAAAALDAVDQLLDLADAGAALKLQGVLLAVEIALAQSPADAGRADDYLARAASWADSLPPENDSVRQYHYRCMQAARTAGSAAARRRHATWLADHGAGDAYETPALVALALIADEAVESAAPSERAARRSEAEEVYRRLIDRLGDSPEALLQRRNALAASSKLAHYEYEAGRFAAAADRLEGILAVFPRDKGYLRRAGLAHYQAGRFEASLRHWRTLLAGLPSDSEEWCEAKYYQLACLGRIDMPLARKVRRQFQQLHPVLPWKEWREKFAALERSLAD